MCSNNTKYNTDMFCYQMYLLNIIGICVFSRIVFVILFNKLYSVYIIKNINTCSKRFKSIIC